LRFYRDGLGLPQLGGFEGHDGYDGVFLDLPGTGAHLELTAGGDQGAPEPHPESLLVLYLGGEDVVAAAVERTRAAPIEPANPYWAANGVTIADPDGFRIVLVPHRWPERSAVEVEWFEGGREILDELFALADDSVAAVRAYRDLGSVLVARDGAAIVGHLQLIEVDPRSVELKSLAVQEERQGEGIGRLLVDRALAESCRAGYSTVVVSTAAAGTDVLRFYQRSGFRMLRVERDAFTPAEGYDGVEIDGIPLRDRVWLSLDLERRKVS